MDFHPLNHFDIDEISEGNVNEQFFYFNSEFMQNYKTDEERNAYREKLARDCKTQSDITTLPNGTTSATDREWSTFIIDKLFNDKSSDLYSKRANFMAFCSVMEGFNAAVKVQDWQEDRDDIPQHNPYSFGTLEYREWYGDMSWCFDEETNYEIVKDYAFSVSLHKIQDVSKDSNRLLTNVDFTALRDSEDFEYQGIQVPRYASLESQLDFFSANIISGTNGLSLIDGWTASGRDNSGFTIKFDGDYTEKVHAVPDAPTDGFFQLITGGNLIRDDRTSTHKIKLTMKEFIHCIFPKMDKDEIEITESY